MTTKKPTHTCCGQIHYMYRSHDCGKNAKYERDGKWYCGTHDPVALQAKAKAREDAWKAQWDADRKLKLEIAAKQKEIQRRADCYPDLLNELENCADLLKTAFPTAPVDSCIGVAIIKAESAIAKATKEIL